MKLYSLLTYEQIKVDKSGNMTVKVDNDSFYFKNEICFFGGTQEYINRLMIKNKITVRQECGKSLLFRENRPTFLKLWVNVDEGIVYSVFYNTCDPLDVIRLLYEEDLIFAKIGYPQNEEQRFEYFLDKKKLKTKRDLIFVVQRNYEHCGFYFGKDSGIPFLSTYQYFNMTSFILAFLNKFDDIVKQAKISRNSVGAATYFNIDWKKHFVEYLNWNTEA